jgi:hypothetical protein
LGDEFLRAVDALDLGILGERYGGDRVAGAAQLVGAVAYAADGTLIVFGVLSDGYHGDPALSFSHSSLSTAYRYSLAHSP